MDAVSYAHSAKQAQRIESFIENPDSMSGIVTVPKVIASGENVTIPSGRVAVLPNVQVDGTLNIDGEVFIPSGATFGDLENQIALKASLTNPAFTSTISTQGVNYKPTPVGVTSWSYSGTTITLNVASHTFVAGDYIEVSGLTSTTYPANGTHLVTSVTGTTIVFTLGATPTGTAGVSSATVKGYATINGRVSESIGVNQTWQNVTRLGNTTYYNTTGKPICLSVRATPASGGDAVQIKVNNQLVAESFLGSTITNTQMFAIIPNGASYMITATSPTLTVFTTFELR